MHPEPDSHQHVRRVVLPSGKTIEVVYFDEHPEARIMPAAHATHAQAPQSSPPQDLQRVEVSDDLHICTCCSSQLVYPVEWEEASDTDWEVTLRCPNCEWTGAGIFTQDIVERFDEELDRGTEALVSDLKRLMHANMEDEIDRFAAALASGFIQPEDF